MLTVPFQKSAGLDMARLRCVGVTSEVFGGHVLYFELSGTQVMYRYFASKQKWERIAWVDDANKYDDKKVSGC